MSEQEQDAAIGRMLREHGENKRKLTALEAELERWSQVLKKLSDCLSHNTAGDFNLTVIKREIQQEPLSSIDFAKLVDFLEDYTQCRKSVERGESQMRQLGIK